MPRVAYRGRLVFIDGDGHETRRYFIINERADASGIPVVITQDTFDFVLEWETT
jgi:hypothetical protein